MSRYLTGKNARNEVVWYTQVEDGVYTMDCTVKHQTEPFSAHQYTYGKTEVTITISQIYTKHGHANVVEGNVLPENFRSKEIGIVRAELRAGRR